MPPGPSKLSSNNKFNFTLDLRLVVVLLLVVIAAMLLIWKPWSAVGANARTVTVTGEATVSAEPDEYLFSPSYQFTGDDREAALASLTKKSEEIVAGLKELGVDDSRIKTSSSGYDTPPFRGQEPDSSTKPTYTLSLTVNIADKDLVQKVQDYLVDTSPTGSVSPQATFSDDKRRELESRARDEATEDAKAKAEQSAGNLGFKLGKVKEVTDGSGFGVFPMRGSAALAEDTAQLPVRPGENDLSYSVTVVYFVK